MRSGCEQRIFSGTLVTTGVSLTRDREVALWDQRDLSKPLKRLKLDRCEACPCTVSRNGALVDRILQKIVFLSLMYARWCCLQRQFDIRRDSVL
jgi:hypothetical protein